MYAKKSLGQNFLKSDKAIRQIVDAADLHPGDTVLEIGPGMGVLTKALLLKGARVIAIEKDDRLIIELGSLFHEEISNGSLVVIHADVLDLVELDGMSPSLKKLLGSKYKLVANIPYYITGEIIQRFHTVPNQPETMVLLVQKEVAERIIARDKKESILSIAVKMYGSPKIISIVPRGAFAPAPNVDSAILCISEVNHFAPLKKEKEFFDLLKRAFAHKRKYLLSNIKEMAAFDTVKKVLLSSGHTESVRSEDVPVALWREMI